MWDRGWDTRGGGGLFWNTKNETKNACVNGPAAIAGFLLTSLTHNASFSSRGKMALDWLTDTLFDSSTGQVADHVDLSGTVDWSAYTYNQGTFIV